MATEKQKNKPKSQQGFSASMFEIMNYEPYLTEDMLINGIEKHKDAIEYWCYIKHNKDKKDDGTPKENHFHGFIKTKANYNAGAIAEWFGQEIQYIGKITSRRYNTGALYCVHAHDREKYQYDPKEVKANFNYEELVRKDAEKQATDARKKEIVELIQNGTIREYNMHQKISAYEFVVFKSVIENAFEYRRRAISDEQRNKEVIFIQGDSGTGKTSYAKKLAQDKNMSFCVAGASNDPLENYKGQDVLILDDLRGSSQRLDDLLKMLDNNTNSMAKSRYHNKVLECQIIIITTTQDINTFFCNVFADSPESIVQLKRRCQTYMQMNREEIFVSLYDEETRDYFPAGQIENPIKNEHPVEKLTQEKIQAKLSFLFGDNIKKIEAPVPENTEASTPLTNDIISQMERENNKADEEDIAMFFSC